MKWICGMTYIGKQEAENKLFTAMPFNGAVIMYVYERETVKIQCPPSFNE